MSTDAGGRALTSAPKAIRTVSATAAAATSTPTERPRRGMCGPLRLLVGQRRPSLTLPTPARLKRAMRHKPKSGIVTLARLRMEGPVLIDLAAVVADRIRG